uniref:Uncharacterized protein n=1 Tax=Meloidogyne javanica TaxID=6303 RepID=A0A915MZJ1_MELJA
MTIEGNDKRFAVVSVKFISLLQRKEALSVRSRCSESTYLFRFVGINNSKESDNWWKLELAVKIGFYLSLITLILAIIRYVYKKKFSSSKRSLYHTVQVKSPPALEEFQEKDIILAAESIRQKLGKKDYERLQEEFI